MVWVIAFLSISNVLLGYGLAVYINRHFGTLVVSRKKVQASTESETTATENENRASAKIEDLAQPIEPTLTPERQIATPMAHLDSNEPASAAAVDEQNVLAGIEEFRSQLAKMTEPTATVEEPEGELVAAGN